MVLAKAPRLRPLVPEQAVEVEEPHRLGQVAHAVLEVGAANARGALRTEGDAIAATVLEGVGLLLHDIRELPHAPDVQARVLEGRRVDPLVAEAGGGL